MESPLASQLAPGAAHGSTELPVEPLTSSGQEPLLTRRRTFICAQGGSAFALILLFLQVVYGLQEPVGHRDHLEDWQDDKMEDKPTSRVSDADMLKYLGKSYVARKVQDGPVLDESTLSKVWDDAPWSDKFDDIGLQKGGMPRPSQATRFKAVYTASHVYFAVEVNTDKDDKTVVSKRQEHEAIHRTDSLLEFFFDPKGNASRYTQLQVNAIEERLWLMLDRPWSEQGLRADNEFSKRARRKNGTAPKKGDPEFFDAATQLKVKWQRGSVSDHPSTYTLEAKIKIEDIATKEDAPSVGNFWRFQVSRHEKMPAQKVQGKNLHWTWNPMRRWDTTLGRFDGSLEGVNLHIPESWGYLVFGDESGSVGKDESDRPDPYWKERVAAGIAFTTVADSYKSFAGKQIPTPNPFQSRVDEAKKQAKAGDSGWQWKYTEDPNSEEKVHPDWKVSVENLDHVTVIMYQDHRVEVVPPPVK